MKKTLLILAFFTQYVFPERIMLEEIKEKYKDEYKLYEYKTKGSYFNRFAKNHYAYLVSGAFGLYAIHKLPALNNGLNHFKISAGCGIFAFTTEKIVASVGDFVERRFKDKTETNNFSIKSNIFQLLEDQSFQSYKSFADAYYNRFGNDQNNTAETYETILEIIKTQTDYRTGQRIEKKDYIPGQIIEKEELQKEIKRDIESRSAKAALELKITQEEAARKLIQKTFEYKEIHKDSKIREFFGWKDHLKEQAAEICKKYRSQEIIYKNTVLYGPPGCGKTSYAENISKEVATQLDKAVIYYYIKNDDIKTKGGDANAAISHVAQLCDQVEALAEDKLVVLFFDEFDGIVTKREELSKKNTTINFQNNDLNAILLQKLEHLRSKKNIIILAATNHIENLDDAVIRDGRFDHKLLIGKPNVNMRAEILGKILAEVRLKLTQEEKNLLLHLTSNQTTVSVSKTIKQYIEYKKKNVPINSDEAIAQFTIESFNAQSKRAGGSCPEEEEIEEWIRESKNNIQKLKEIESKNPEIVSIKDIENQAKFPSLQFDLQGLLERERLNETVQEKLTKKMINSLNNIREALTDNSKALSTSLKDITSQLITAQRDSSCALREALKDNSKALSTSLKDITSQLAAAAQLLKSQEEQLRKLVTILASEQIVKQAMRDILKNSILYLNLTPEISGRDACGGKEVTLNAEEIKFLKDNIDTLLICMERICMERICMGKEEMENNINKLFWSLSYYLKYVKNDDCKKKINSVLKSDKYTKLFDYLSSNWERLFSESEMQDWIQGSAFFKHIDRCKYDYGDSSSIRSFIEKIKNICVPIKGTTSAIL